MGGTFSYYLQYIEIWWQHAGPQWRETTVINVSAHTLCNLLQILEIKTFFSFCFSPVVVVPSRALLVLLIRPPLFPLPHDAPCSLILLLPRQNTRTRRTHLEFLCVNSLGHTIIKTHCYHSNAWWCLVQMTVPC